MKDRPLNPKEPGYDTPYKKAFAKISEEKRRRILDTATRVFAERGFIGANINFIAEEAGISIGAMYNYVDTKEDLFLTVIDNLHDILEEELMDLVDESMDFFQAVESMMRGAIIGATNRKEFTTLYLNTSAEPINGLSARLTQKLEGITLALYRNLIETAKTDGTLPGDADTEMLAFLIDNQIVALQRAYATDYHRERMKLFLGDTVDENDVVDRFMIILKRAAGVKA